MRKLIWCCGFAAVLFAASAVQADLISEFEPNPVGTDPATVDIELSGTAGAAFSGYLSSIDTDTFGGGTGIVGVLDRSNFVSGTYDGNGLAVVSIGDLENPSFAFVFHSDEVVVGTDLDVDDDLLIDDVSVFGTVFDAIQIADSVDDGSVTWGSQLGGIDFAYSGDEPKLTFRDSSTGAWYSVNDAGDTPEAVFDEFGNQLANSGFSADPEVTTFGAINPFFTPIPEPSSAMLIGLAIGGIAVIRRRK